MTKNLRFKFTFAFRNATKSRGRFVVILFTLIMMFMLSIMLFGMKAYLTDIFTLEFREQYQDVDLIVTYDNYSSSRIVNSRVLKEDYDEYFSSIATFFNLHSLIKVDEQSIYTQIFSSSLSEFERVVKYDVSALSPNEILITESLAKKLNISAYSQIYLEISNQDISYYVKAIVPDQGLFTNDSVFINKEELFERTVWSSSPNLGNIIYLDVRDEYALKDVKTLLLSDENYQDCSIYETIDTEQILVRVKFNTSIMLGMIIIVFLAMAMVIKSLFPLLFRDFSQQLGVIKLLGGSNHFAFHIWILQFLIYFLICVPLGFGLANLFMNIGARLYNVHSYIGIKALPALFAILLFLLFMFWQVFHQYHQLTQKNELTLTIDRKMEKQTADGYYAIALGSLLLINFLFNPFPKYQALITMLAVIGFTFVVISLLMRWSVKLFPRKHSFFSLYSIKYLSQNKVIHNSLKVIFISLVVLAVSLTLSRMFKATQLKAKDEVEVDYLITNIYDYQEDLLEDVSKNFIVNDINSGIIYRDVTMDFAENESRLLRFVFSIDSQNINNYFDYLFIDDSLSNLQDTTKLSIVLPYQYEKIGLIKKGDIVTLYISQEIPQENFEVVGFFANFSEGAVFTNLHLSDKYKNSSLINTLFINSNDPNIQKELIKTYSNRMYFVFDAQALMLEDLDKLVAVADFLSFIIWILVGCFVLVIINNSLLVFYSIKADYAKIKILGCKNSELFVNIAKEIIVLMVLAFIASFANVIIVFNLFPSLMIMVGFYFQYEYAITDVLWYLLIGISVFSFSYVYYFFKVRNMNLILETINP
ncbi:MAG: hypothetical protein AB7V00_01580 [Bacilli bacterium]